MRGAQEGDGGAFGQLYDAYSDTVYRYIYHRVSQKPLAQDLTSEAFLRALRLMRLCEIGSVGDLVVVRWPAGSAAEQVELRSTEALAFQELDSRYGSLDGNGGW